MLLIAAFVGCATAAHTWNPDNCQWADAQDNGAVTGALPEDVGHVREDRCRAAGGTFARVPLYTNPDNYYIAGFECCRAGGGAPTMPSLPCLRRDPDCPSMRCTAAPAGCELDMRLERGSGGICCPKFCAFVQATTGRPCETAVTPERTVKMPTGTWQVSDDGGK